MTCSIQYINCETYITCYAHHQGIGFIALASYMPVFEIKLSNCFENVRFLMKKCKKLSLFQELCSSIMKNLLNRWRNKTVCIS